MFAFTLAYGGPLAKNAVWMLRCNLPCLSLEWRRSSENLRMGGWGKSEIMNYLNRIAIVLLVVVSCSGCIALAVGAVGGAAGVTYVKGNLNDNFDASVKQVHAATVMALESMALPIHENRQDFSSAKLRSEYADGKEIWITIDATTSRSSEIVIRVGATGDQQRSRRILNAINANL